MLFLARKFFFFLVSVLLVAVVAGGTVALVMAYKDKARFEMYKAQLEAKIEGLSQKCDRVEEYLGDLQSDPQLLEHVARKRLGYSEKDELVFRFSENT